VVAEPQRASGCNPVKRGLNIVGFVRAELGIGEAARLLIAAVRAAQIPYAVVPVEKFVPSRQEHPFFDLGTGKPTYDVNVIVLNPPELLGFAADGGAAALLDSRYTIGNWWWEVTQFPESMQVATHLVDEVWVGSTHAADSVSPAVLKPVLTFRPPVVRPSVPPVDRTRFGVPAESFFFLFTFDFHSIFQRKNPLAVVKAFATAFTPGEGPHLLVKSINGVNRPQELAQLEEAADERRDIHVVDGYVAAEEQHGLIAECDAYVSLHRAEGFGLTMAEAMAFAKPVIATGYSGNLEFMHASNSHLVPYQLTTIPAGCEPYPEGGEWAEPDVEAAAALLRRVYDHPQDARRLGQRARTDIERLHSPEARAQFLATRLETIERARQSVPAVRGRSGEPRRAALGARHFVGRIAFAAWQRLPERGRKLAQPLLTALRHRA
jgi:glycosyltransferase involved in cell wall biosynthesis